MGRQYIVAVLLEADLNVTAAGPFRSKTAAEAACDQINDAGTWSDSDGAATATIIAQVVTLDSVAHVVELARRGEGNRL